jgi:hypothetical protein
MVSFGLETLSNYKPQLYLHTYIINLIVQLWATLLDKGIGNRARYLCTPEARKARPRCNHSQSMSSCRIPIL